jgi:hypothetical protein
MTVGDQTMLFGTGGPWRVIAEQASLPTIDSASPQDGDSDGNSFTKDPGREPDVDSSPEESSTKSDSSSTC